MQDANCLCTLLLPDSGSTIPSVRLSRISLFMQMPLSRQQSQEIFLLALKSYRHKLSPDMPGGDLQEALKRLGDSGLYGTAYDFSRWLRFREKVDADEEQVRAALDALIAEGRFERHADYLDDYVSTQVVRLPDSFSFECPRELSDSPIQFFRSLLLVFLRQKQVDAELEVDIVIASVEAIENAVKYSSAGDISVKFELVSGEFRLEVVNYVKPAEPDDDIVGGKYDSSRTLMRGMMVMSRLFDEIDIDIEDTIGRATFRARKAVRS